jgi:hypothetical protein
MVKNKMNTVLKIRIKLFYSTRSGIKAFLICPLEIRNVSVCIEDHNFPENVASK